MPFHADFRDGICDVIAGNANLNLITPYCALFNGNPSSGGSEVTSTIDSAGRQLISFAAPSGGDMANDVAVDFGIAEGNATVSYVAIYDASTSGNLIAWAALAGGSEAVVIGNAVRFNIGDLSVSVD